MTVTGNFDGERSPLSWRSYGMFGFLSGTRNLSQSPVIAPARGLPADWPPEPPEGLLHNGAWDAWYSAGNDLGHCASWLTLDELLAYDYDQSFVDRRGGADVTVVLRDFLGRGFFNDLEQMRQMGIERIVFGYSF
ncbi:hypothetical protein GURKE_00840 [Brevundimonas phage vB_BpoS-Gurke]|uniref:Uncharacterized protein n=1 Tax=Brevundimonas phage vB_BpoS-Gurke TaxID=2948599 RepID=A0A9E7SSM9_9CAUD|nr:hypothetical protein GURKE_00840 [Brevundimonas phage vB_BpoS-Gurke]